MFNHTCITVTILLEYKTEAEQPALTQTANEANKRHISGMGLPSTTVTLSPLVNEFAVCHSSELSYLSLTFHSQKSEDKCISKACIENVNISLSTIYIYTYIANSYIDSTR